MAAEMVTPTDYLSGLPLPIAPMGKWLALDNPSVADVHHAHHPCRDPQLKTLAGMALRNTALQITERELHNSGPNRYHRFYTGPPIPVNESDIFTRIVLNCAGYIPSQGIDLSGDAPVVRDLSPKENDFLRTPKEGDQFGYRYYGYRYDPIRNFFRDFSTKQDLNHLTESTIEQFLHTSDMPTKQKLGRFLLMQVCAVAGDQVRGKYKLLQKSQLLHPAMPPEPQILIRYKLGLADLGHDNHHGLLARETLMINMLQDNLRLKAA